MRIVSYLPQENLDAQEAEVDDRLPAVMVDDSLVDLCRGVMFFRRETAVRESITDLLYNHSEIQRVIDKARSVHGKSFNALSDDEMQFSAYTRLDSAQIKLTASVFHVHSLRDFYAFETHVKTANANRGRDVPAEWYEFPVFYYNNPNVIYGDGDIISYPSYTNTLDYELEIACVIGKEGIDIKAEDAEDYIFGYTIFNDWSARDIQRK
jgi:2-keto-4-pentenoate hydratase/2-oxohepta-3-ene-1,7-dioic acid hydratase in catechol pathway